VVLVNSNPATIMTDPEMADRTYIEPSPRNGGPIIEKERPDALLPTLGGQTGLNLAVALAETGSWSGYGVEMIGAKLRGHQKAEDRELFRRPWTRIGLGAPAAAIATTMDEARAPRRSAFPSSSAQLHPGRHRRRHRLQPEEFEEPSAAPGLDASP
jgi:carbamoyl-phosphate synthase large subunit